MLVRLPRLSPLVSVHLKTMVETVHMRRKSWTIRLWSTLKAYLNPSVQTMGLKILKTKSLCPSPVLVSAAVTYGSLQYLNTTTMFLQKALSSIFLSDFRSHYHKTNLQLDTPQNSLKPYRHCIYSLAFTAAGCLGDLTSLALWHS